MRDARDEPFFLYLAHMYVHLPIYVQERFADASATAPTARRSSRSTGPRGASSTSCAALGLDDDTIVIFTSDNGSRARVDGGSNAPAARHQGHDVGGRHAGARASCAGRARIDAGPDQRRARPRRWTCYPTLAALLRRRPARPTARSTAATSRALLLDDARVTAATRSSTTG